MAGERKKTNQKWHEEEIESIRKLYKISFDQEAVYKLYFDVETFESAKELAINLYHCHLLRRITKIKWLRDPSASETWRILLFVTPSYGEKKDLQEIGQTLLKSINYTLQNFDVSNLNRIRNQEKPQISCYCNVTQENFFIEF